METASDQARGVGPAGAAMHTDRAFSTALSGLRLRRFAKVLRKTATPAAIACVIFNSPREGSVKKSPRLHQRRGRAMPPAEHACSSRKSGRTEVSHGRIKRS